MEVRADQALDLLLRHRLNRPTPIQHFANHQVDPKVPWMHEETRASERQGKGLLYPKILWIILRSTLSLF